MAFRCNATSTATELGGAVPAEDRGLLTDVTDAVGDVLRSGPGLPAMISSAMEVLLFRSRNGFWIKHPRMR